MPPNAVHTWPGLPGPGCQAQAHPLHHVKQSYLSLSLCSSGRTSQHMPTPKSPHLGQLYILTTETTSLIPLVKTNCPFTYSYAFKRALLLFCLFKELVIFVCLSHQGFSKSLLNDTSLFLLLMLPKPEVWGFYWMPPSPPFPTLNCFPSPPSPLS